MEDINVKTIEDTSSSVIYLSPENKLINIKQKHKDSLLLAVYENEWISHFELATILKISPSGLKASVDKICEGCEPQNSPLEFKKINKYKYYHLTDIGKQYVEHNLISVEGRKFEKKLCEYWEIFQIRVKHDIDKKMVHLLKQYAKMDEVSDNDDDQNIINSFMDCLFEFYLKMPQDALGTLENLIADGKIRDKIKAILCDKNEDRKIIEPLKEMAFEEHPEDMYQFANFTIEHIIDWDSENIWKLNGQYEWEIMKPVMLKIESDMLRAMMNFKDGGYLRRLWISNGMDIHLAYYLEEKYKYLLLKHEQDREKGEENGG